jgi:hypothetical protein
MSKEFDDSDLGLQRDVQPPAPSGRNGRPPGHDQPPPFRFPVRRTLVGITPSDRGGVPPRHLGQRTVLARQLQRLAHELLQPPTLESAVLSVLAYHPTSTTQLASILRRRKSDVVAVVRALVAAGKLERRGHRWIRVKERTP